MDKINIEYCCFLNQCGYSQASQNIILALHESDIFNISIRKIGGSVGRPAISDDRYRVFEPMLNKKIEGEDVIQVYHCIPTLQRRIPKRKRNIAFATFETFSPPKNWIDILNENDAILAPSKFNYDIFAHSSINKPIFYLPHCLDFNRYNLNVKPLKKYDRFSFLFLGTWKERKGYKQLLEAWLREFKDTDKVQLVIKTDKANKAKKYLSKLKKQIGITKGFAPIFFESKILSEKDMPSFIKSFDCLISPSWGEGFNLPGIQSMALGVPVIITDFSGPKDYITDKNAILLKPNGYIYKRSLDGIPQFRNKKWAFISIDEIRRKMRFSMNNQGIIKQKALVGYKNVSKHFRYNNIKNKFIKILEQIYDIYR